MQFLGRIIVVLTIISIFSIHMVIGSCPSGSNDTPENNINFLLYTRDNRYTPDIADSHEAFAKCKHFNNSHQSIVFINEFQNCSERNYTDLKIKDAYLDKTNYNFILVDWFNLKNLKLSSKSINELAGTRIGKFILRLHNERLISLSQLYIIAFGRGAHVAAEASKTLQESGTLLIGRITALNPLDMDTKRPMEGVRLLNKSSAKYVDIIFTASKFSYKNEEPIGHVDFYVNFAANQDKCGLNICCEHNLAWTYYINTVRNPHIYPAWRCDFNFPGSDCTKVVGQYMGMASNPKEPGVFHVRIL